MKLSKRFKRLYLLTRCLVRGVTFGRADRIPAKASRIILVPTGKLGDVICVTQVMVAIRKHLPEAHLTIAGNSRLHKMLLSDSGLADEYLDLISDGALERIRENHADTAIVSGPSFEFASLLFLAGVPLVIGPTPVGGVAHDVTRPYKLLQKFIVTFPHQIDAYAPRERLKALEPLGIETDDTRKHLGFSEAGDKKAEEILSTIKHPYRYLVGISAGSGNKEKQWPPEHFARVANFLIKNYDAHIIVIGGKNDLVESGLMISGIEDKTRVTDTTSITIDELKALMAKLSIFVSVNTGPIYIAEAFDIPTVDILGPVNPWDQPPRGQIHKMVFPPGKPKPLLNIMNTRNHEVSDAVRIAESTRYEDVISAVEEALKEADQARNQRG